MITKLILVVILLISLITDIKYRKILNIVTLPAILIAFFYFLLFHGFEGVIFSGKGFITGFGLLIIPYLLGGMGAGDVKLVAAIGALMGTSFVFYSFIYMGLIGGLIAAVLIVKQRGIIDGIVKPIKMLIYRLIFFRSSLGSLVLPKYKNSTISFPYGVAIVLGTFCTLIWGGF